MKRFNNGLNDSDLQKFEAGFIDMELAQAAQLRRVDDVEGAEIVGRKRAASTSFSGIAIPYFSPGDYSRVRGYRLRRDHTEYDSDGIGGLKERGKYLAPPGRGNMIYFPPRLSLADLADIELPIVITEGEKKTLALLRLAIEKTGEKRFVPIGISGVWNWKGTVAKTENARGAKVPVIGVIPDFDLIAWRGRTVYVLFDTNVHTNDKVRVARDRLGRELAKRGANVLYAELPKDCGVNGIDDYLGGIEQELGIHAAVAAGLKLVASAIAFKVVKPSQANGIVELAEDVDLFHTPDGEYFASFVANGHLETHSTRSKAFREFLARQYFECEGKSPSSQAMQDALDVLNGKARFEGRERNVHLRLASFNENIYLDLCNEAWQVVEIHKDGHSLLSAHDCPVRFRRTKHMRSLPTPAESGSFDDLRPFLNLDDEGDDSYLLLLGWLVNCLRPDYPFPVLVVTGEPGTAKSTTTRLLRELIDPSFMSHRACPRTEQDLMIAANNSWICAYDNVSGLPNWLSDAFCRLSTGGGIGGRTLYENDEETLLRAKRPIILNGIGNFAGRSDLIDRALILNLKVIPKNERKSEREFWMSFEEVRPSIFTALISAASTALRRLDGVRFDELPRMADFAQWATAAEPALEIAPGGFLNAYIESRAGVHEIVLEGSAIGDVVQEYCRDRGRFSEEILLKEFLEVLKMKAGDKAQDFPKTSKKLRNELQRINPNLREIGIRIDLLGRTGASASKGASLRIEHTPVTTSQTSQTSESPLGMDRLTDVINDGLSNTSSANVIDESYVIRIL